jgi:signal transduction histidine kinase
LAGVVEKRQSLHKRLADEEQLREDLESQLEQAQALANIGMVSAMIAHEMNNILTPLGSYAQLSLQHPEDNALARKAVEKAVVHSAHAGAILDSMLAMADGRGQEKKRHNLAGLIDEVFRVIARDFSKDGITVQIRIPDQLEVWAEGVCLEHVLMNLILNCHEAMSGKGNSLEISAEESSDSVRIKVSDSGCGIERRNLPKIFEPFFSTKTEANENERRGAGMGLAFCKKVIDAHDGIITVESSVGKGTTFEIVLPKDHV